MAILFQELAYSVKLIMEMVYNLTTDQYGMTPQIVLASDFHLDSQV